MLSVIAYHGESVRYADLLNRVIRPSDSEINYLVSSSMTPYAVPIQVDNRDCQVALG
jgi:hypothetical protein